jgi:hypothetical protein
LLIMTSNFEKYNEELEDIKVKFTGYWIYINSRQKPNYEITGKYLFFYDEIDRLIEIAKNEIRNHSFHVAKVNSSILGSNTDHVLCLYFKDDSRKYELADRSKFEYQNVKYRYWKSDIDTIRGKYSPEFLGKLSNADKKRFTKN